ncbi:hypothetical protein ACFOY4_10145 [Actinomadura syzygii]|uniref:TIGR02391 family protein n=1 Tax=Actinomadura syzygii TaxID=1427538 RepID=A0A5D0UFB7_9ACTN|nr:hypothetical protein [Actinomadura syzygii]TYC15829.1 hypothetical protein FXF65_10825 [Actinomadura syzygii]
MMKVASAARLSISPNSYTDNIHKEIVNHCIYDELIFLDVIDSALVYASKQEAIGLESALAEGGSAWRVSVEEKELQRRVSSAAQSMADKAMAVSDIASEELQAAWSAAYGRSPDPSDAWDHAIKAVEALWIPLIVPKQEKPQLGHVLGQLDRQGELFKFILPGEDMKFEVKAVVGMLKTLWPNPDRHASENRRTPSLQEAQAVVHLAVVLVQWARDGAVSRR